MHGLRWVNTPVTYKTRLCIVTSQSWCYWNLYFDHNFQVTKNSWFFNWNIILKLLLTRKRSKKIRWKYLELVTRILCSGLSNSHGEPEISRVMESENSLICLSKGPKILYKVRRFSSSKGFELWRIHHSKNKNSILVTRFCNSNIFHPT